MYRLQNAAVALSALNAFVASFLALGGVPYWVCVLATIFVGAVSSIGCQGSSLSVEREWTKALSLGDSSSLAGLNAGMQTPLQCPVFSNLLCLQQKVDCPSLLRPACGLAILRGCEGLLCIMRVHSRNGDLIANLDSA